MNKEDIVKETEEILLYYICKKLKENKTTSYGIKCPNEVLVSELMVLVCHDLDKAYKKKYNSTVAIDLKLTTAEFSKESFIKICDKIIKSGIKFNYICCIFYVVGEIIVHYAKHKLEKECVRKLLNNFNLYFSEKCLHFMLENNGWKGFANHYTRDW